MGLHGNLTGLKETYTVGKEDVDTVLNFKVEEFTEDP